MLPPGLPFGVVELLFETRGVMHDAVQALGLMRVAAAHRDPAVGGESSGVLRPAGLGQRAAGTRQGPGQRVDGLLITLHG